jgi:hypothetical protein
MHLKNQNINDNKVILNFGTTEFGITGAVHFYCTSTIGTFWNLEVRKGGPANGRDCEASRDQGSHGRETDQAERR